MKNNDWLKIKDGVLIDCSLNATGEIVIPESVTSIGDYAFHRCTDLTSIIIPNSVTRIEEDAFCGCRGLTSINIPNSVTSIGEGAFYDCTGLKSINIPNSVTRIEDLAFYNCTSLTSINIPNSVTSIGGGAFAHCRGLVSINIPNSVTSIGEDAFYDCTGLKSINIPNSITSIGYGAFSGCTSLYTYPKNDDKVIAYKGFENINGKLICRNKVYSLTELNTETDAKICKCGIHACLLSIDVLRFYNSDYIYKVEMSGKFDYRYGDSKICATEMRILEKINKEDLVKETIKVIS